MEWLNYHHLLYFWVVAREGSIARACERLGLAQPTISGQLRDLEQSLGEALFHRAGRGLVLTETGKMVFGYADDIFKLGQELQNAVKDRRPGRPRRLVVGVTDVLPKLVVHRLLEPVQQLDEPVHLVVREGKPERLLGDLAIHNLDVVLSDAPPASFLKVKVFSHPLGECGVSFFARDDLARRHAAAFPACLHNAPILLPTEESAVRRSLEQWFRSERITPVVRGEFDDSALLKTFGRAGKGMFAMPSVIEEEVCRQYEVRVIGRAERVRVRCYAITAGRRLEHPAVAAVCASARNDLFTEEIT